MNLDENKMSVWAIAPDPIKEAEISSSLNTEVLVVGAGNAGFFAAIAAAEKGAKTTLIERESHLSLIRTYIGGVKTKAQKRAGIEIDKYELVEEICRYASHRVDQRLIKLWADKSGEVIDWLEEEILKPNGAYLHAESDTGNPNDFYKAYPTQHDAQTDADGFSFAPCLEDKAYKLGVDIRYNTPMVQLIRSKSDERITGVIAKDEDGNYIKINASKGVILCTGGYANNVEMLKEINPIAYKENVYCDAPANYGEGISAATWVGADKDEVPTVLVFDRGIVPPGTKASETYIQQPFKNFFWFGSQPFLKVNLRGERFANESVPYDWIVNAAGLQPGDLYCQIWDSNWKEDVARFQTLGCSRIQYPSPTGGLQSKVSVRGYEGAERDIEKYVNMGYVKKADTIEELAEKLQIPADSLKATVGRYNELAEKGIDEDFGKEKHRLSKVAKAPFYGCVLGGRILCTLDGLRINTNMQVLDKESNPIEGLYAAGNDSGGFFGVSYPEHIPGLACSRAFTFGRLAGQKVASH
ncbi:FAD-dependent oxidoreductase [Lederbergia sp. NSJ-179]|uniref:FAD-dependent oxidoreductase n=1 Tax=Lederbergia sp. NSJ-179 TaxID=2931402 RepID=UPI001FD3782F|nr:FAD-dependent oxidoreductase [Lederbergia sp. NSJ-179]MCJ7841754.1 FAD-dependent oxidoreductase [Lederbergia sp. NSJ-179]